MDGWWLADPAKAVSGPRQDEGANAHYAPGRGALALLVLVAIGDLLFFRQAVGLSLALFAVAVFLAVALTQSLHLRRGPVILLVLSALPVVEHLQPLSLAFLGLGLTASLLWAQGGTGALGQRALALWATLPWRGALDGYRQTTVVLQSDTLRGQWRAARGWAFPAGGALVLAGLLLLANPLLVQMLSDLFAIRGPGVLTLGRLSLWLGLALMLWPLIAPPPPAVRAELPALPACFRPSAQSVARGLLVFNAILAVQTVMDAAYLWGGASLPAGLTAAKYAHRGAYPLLATALLVGAFALSARPFAREDRRLRGLLLLWLAQNVALVLSALLRLELYVEAFGLTYLRLHSAIWMGLVAAGLGLTAWQVWRDRSNLWLLTRSAGLALATLYACGFINFAAIVATENLSRDNFDGTYVCELGPTAAAAVAAAGREIWTYDRDWSEYMRCPTAAPVIQGWRDWGFRDWRVRRYSDAILAEKAANEDSGRR
ncbi:MAG: DUF4173 domain-containing protein [Tabrizicola sp.]|nr:DUF4173 domain-containing protein [Tabrizicola sp.]